MKKILTLLAMVIVLPGGAAAARELGNPATLLKQGHFAVGFQWTAAVEQEFEDYDLKRTYSDGYRNTDRKGAEFEDDQYYMATITYGVCDRFNLFAALGMADGGKWMDRQAGNDWQADLDSNFVWAVGAKAKLYQFENGLGFGLAARYLRYDNRRVTNWKARDTGETAGDLGWSTDDEFDFWQFDAVASTFWDLGAFTPYLGAGYTTYDVDFQGMWTHSLDAHGWIRYDASFSNENKFSALAGVNVNLGEHFKVNVQGNFVSSTALTLGISYVF